MSETETLEQTEEQAEETPETEEESSVEESSEQVEGQEDKPASESQETEEKPESKVEVIHTSQETIDPAPPKEINLPDTPEFNRILKLQVPIIVRLAEKTMTTGEIMDISPGTIIEFDKIVDEELDLMLNNKCIGVGQAVKISENFGLKITNIASLEKVINAMATGN